MHVCRSPTTTRDRHLAPPSVVRPVRPARCLSPTGLSPTGPDGPRKAPTAVPRVCSQEDNERNPSSHPPELRRSERCCEQPGLHRAGPAIIALVPAVSSAFAHISLRQSLRQSDVLRPQLPVRCRTEAAPRVVSLRGRPRSAWPIPPRGRRGRRYDRRRSAPPRSARAGPDPFSPFSLVRTPSHFAIHTCESAVCAARPPTIRGATDCLPVALQQWQEIGHPI